MQTIDVIHQVGNRAAPQLQAEVQNLFLSYQPGQLCLCIQISVPKGKRIYSRGITVGVVSKNKPSKFCREIYILLDQVIYRAQKHFLGSETRQKLWVSTLWGKKVIPILTLLNFLLVLLLLPFETGTGMEFLCSGKLKMKIKTCFSP